MEKKLNSILERTISIESELTNLTDNYNDAMKIANRCLERTKKLYSEFEGLKKEYKKIPTEK